MADGGVPLSGGPPGWLAPTIAAVGGMVGAALLWLGQRLIGKAAIQTALNDTFAKITKELHDELAIAKAERFELRQTLDRERITAARREESFRSEAAGLRQLVESLQRRLRAAGLPSDPLAPHSPPVTADNPTAPVMIVLASTDPFTLPGDR